MRITAFFDGRPGHEKQTRAILQGLQKSREVKVQEIHLKRSSLPARLTAYLRLNLLPDGGCRYRLDSSQLLLGTGTTTHLPLLSCKKKYALPAVVCMAPDLYLRSRFDLCFVPRHDGLRERANIFLTDGPPVLAPADIPEDENAGLILIGGVDESSHYWDVEGLLKNIEKITSREGEKFWKISSSPRTPEETCRALERFAKNTANARFFHFQDTPAGWIEHQYAEAAVVWVTVDSMSMVYEALTAGCRVGLLPLRWKRETNKFKKSMDLLVDRHLALPFGDWENGGKKWSGKRAFNEAERCADEIVARWFKEN